MSFQIHALAQGAFAPYFTMTDEERRNNLASLVEITNCPGFPCRVSLEDAQVGETVLAVNYQHQPANNHYQASHAIYVREGATQATPEIGSIPELLLIRPISVRAFDATDLIVEATVAEGTEVENAIRRLLELPAATYLHLHYAAPGCFAAKVTAVD